LARLQSDLVSLCIAAINGRLGEQSIAWDPRAALGVVLAAGGYPNDYEKGLVVSGLPESDGTTSKVFHAGTALRGDTVVTAGGRVLCVVGLGDSVAEARDIAYAEVARISFAGAFCRKDIGYRAIAREQQTARC
ncbi:MAG: phosphoribosylamine--glycine ligase, partial [Halioglobus sp.]|nr:phosphoribosylamine--glycine ligase [Halioglobus sp.]